MRYMLSTLVLAVFMFVLDWRLGPVSYTHLWKMNYFSDMNVRGINSEDYIQMLFCLNDGVSWNIAGSRDVYKRQGDHGR